MKMVTTRKQESEARKGEERSMISFIRLEQHMTFKLCIWVTLNNKNCYFFILQTVKSKQKKKKRDKIKKQTHKILKSPNVNIL